MIRVIKPFIALLIATTFLTMGNGLMNSLLSINMRLQDYSDQTILMIAAILFVLCLVPISITRAVNPQPLEVTHYNVIKLFQLAPLSMVGSFIAGLTNGSFYAMGPMFGLDIGLAVPQVSLFMSATIWAGLLFQYPVGLVSDRLDRLTVLSALGFIVMLVSIAIAVLGRAGLGVLMPLTVCFGIVFTPVPVVSGCKWWPDLLMVEDLKAIHILI